MAAFEYEALDSGGRTKRGMISADSARLARQELRRKQLVPVKVTVTSERRQSQSRFALSRRGLGAKELTLLTRQLATLISAAAPVEEALNMMAHQAEKPRIRRTLMAIRARVTEGYRLSEALGEAPATFSTLYRAMVAAGETAGTLGPVLERLADHLEKNDRLRAKILTALTYPAFLSVVAVGVIAALMTFVVPRVVDQFTDMGQELPMLTTAMIAVSDGVRLYGLPVLMAAALAGAAFLYALRRPSFRRRVDGGLLKLPVIGRLLRNLQTARFARTMATLLASGCSVIEGLTAAERVLKNRIFRDAVGTVRTQVSEGSSLSAALHRNTVFPPMIGYMAASGENSGQLDVMLGKVADYLEREFEDFTSAALSLLEPAIIILMGGVVTLIVLSILMPILQLNTLAVM